MYMVEEKTELINHKSRCAKSVRIPLAGLFLGSSYKIVKLHKFHPYKLQTNQQLSEDDIDHRIEFCEIMIKMINTENRTVSNICFSDECSFFLNGVVNRHNCEYWSAANPYHDEHPQYSEKLTVWAGILGDRIIGPLFINQNLSGENYLNMLEHEIDLLITEAFEEQVDDGVLSEDLLHFQQDEAPQHNVLAVCEWLDERFTNKWIGSRGVIEWPAKSPDLSPIDFFLWGYLKSTVYKTLPENLSELRQRIVNECRKITPTILQKARSEFENRLCCCLEGNGAHFEHFT